VHLVGDLGHEPLAGLEHRLRQDGVPGLVGMVNRSLTDRRQEQRGGQQQRYEQRERDGGPSRGRHRHHRLEIPRLLARLDTDAADVLDDVVAEAPPAHPRDGQQVEEGGERAVPHGEL